MGKVGVCSVSISRCFALRLVRVASLVSDVITYVLADRYFPGLMGLFEGVKILCQHQGFFLLEHRTPEMIRVQRPIISNIVK